MTELIFVILSTKFLSCDVTNEFIKLWKADISEFIGIIKITTLKIELRNLKISFNPNLFKPLRSCNYSTRHLNKCSSGIHKLFYVALCNWHYRIHFWLLWGLSSFFYYEETFSIQSKMPKASEFKAIITIFGNLRARSNSCRIGSLVILVSCWYKIYLSQIYVFLEKVTPLLFKH